MYRSIEGAMAAEFAVDMLALWAALRPVQRVRFGRLIFASAIGAAISGFGLVLSPAPALRIFIAVASAPILARICSGRTSLTAMTGATAGLLVMSAMISGAIHIMSSAKIPMPLIAAPVAVLGAILFGTHRRWLDSWETRLTIRHNGVCTSFTALIDTGNRLSEPLSGLPVMIVEEALLRGILPDSFDPSDALATLPTGFRLVPYGGVGGKGTLGCFMPAELYAYDRMLTGIWIAPYPGSLPGRHRALAPPAVINTIQSKRRKIKCPAQDP